MTLHYLEITLSVCLSILSLSASARVISTIKVKRKSLMIDRLRAQIDELHEMLAETRKGKDFQDGIVTLLNHYMAFHGRQPIIAALISHANQLDDIKDFGRIHFMGSDEKVRFIKYP